MSSDNLGDLFNQYGSDKDRNGYTPMYHAIFKHIKDRPIDMLEIGIGTMIPGVHSSMVGYALPGYAPGGSLRAWRDYFKNGNIVGCDVQTDTQFTDERITTVLSDSTNRDKVEETFGDRTFDIILDDGSHYDEHQLQTFMNFWDRVRPGGFYIVEDIYPNSRMSGQMKDTVAAMVGNSGTLFLTEKKNVLIISKKL